MKPDKHHQIEQQARRVIAYLRVSTDGQEEGNGLAVQRQTICAYAAANGITIDDWTQDIESGAKEARPGLTDLRTLVESGSVAQVLVYRLDRLARDSFLAEKLHRELSSKAIVVSVSESFGDGFTGTLMRQIVQAFAEYERAVIASRLKSGRRQAAKTRGTASGGLGCLGYRSTGSAANSGHGRLEVVEREAEAVRLIFTLRSDGLTLRAICDELNALGCHTTKGTAFAPVHIKRVLDRKAFYRGEALLVRSYGPVEAAHLPILL